MENILSDEQENQQELTDVERGKLLSYQHNPLGWLLPAPPSVSDP
jgi:hypothetical protein